jgi:hypothetical protein
VNWRDKKKQRSRIGINTEDKTSMTIHFPIRKIKKRQSQCQFQMRMMLHHFEEELLRLSKVKLDKKMQASSTSLSLNSHFRSTN